MKNEGLTLDLELIAATIGYYQPIGRWKKSIGMTDDKLFDKFSPIAVKATVRALDELGILEKHPASDKKGAIYRLHAQNLEEWHKILGTLIAGGSILPPIGLRDLAMLYVAATFQSKHGRPVKTGELYFRTAQNQPVGLLNDFMILTGILDEVVFETTSTIYLHRSAKILSDYGLLVERGSRAQAIRKPFEVTPAGLALVAKMKRRHWRYWIKLADNLRTS